MEKEELIDQLNKINAQPGGKQFIRFFANSAGSIPLVGGFIAALGNVWGELDQEEFNKKITEWASQTDIDLSKVMSVLEEQLKEPSRANLSLLLGEVLNVELPLSYPEEGELFTPVILHSDSIAELKPYEQKGYISMHPNGNSTNMGFDNRIGNSIEDKKRPWGRGDGFVIRFHKSIYEVDA